MRGGEWMRVSDLNLQTDRGWVWRKRWAMGKGRWAAPSAGLHGIGRSMNLQAHPRAHAIALYALGEGGWDT